MEDASHGRLDGTVVEIDGFGIVCAARGAKWLSGSEQGFDGFVAQDEQRRHRPETGQQRLVAAGGCAPAGGGVGPGVLFIIKGGGGGARLWCVLCWGCGRQRTTLWADI